MKQQRAWQVRRGTVAVATGQQRWDRAYQLLLQWAAVTPPAPMAVPALPTLPEALHAHSDLRPRLD